MSENRWCRQLGIEPPNLERVKSHPEANNYSLFLMTLLERGEPMTLEEVAARFDEAGIAPAAFALASLKRSKPGRPPAYLDGGRYHLDPNDDDLDLWVFRLGLRPPRVARLQVVRPAPPPLPGSEVPLTSAELDEAWKDASLTSGWSAQRLAVAVLDAQGGPLPAEEVAARIAARTRWHIFRPDTPGIGRRGSPISVGPDGRWSLSPDAEATVRATRKAVRNQLEKARRGSRQRSTPEEIEASSRAAERRRTAHAEALGRLSRAVIVAFPRQQPEWVSLVDLGAHEIQTFSRGEFEALRARLKGFDAITGVEIRSTLRALRVDPEERWLGELSPAQKTIRLNRAGRTLKLTTAMLVSGSCGISSRLGDEKTLTGYLKRREEGKLRRRLESDAKALTALYAYGRLHGYVRLRWGFLDERLPAPWAHRDERVLDDLEKAALAMDVPLEVVVGTAPGWESPWARMIRVQVFSDPEHPWRRWLLDEHGAAIEEPDIQAARLPVQVH